MRLLIATLGSESLLDHFWRHVDRRHHGIRQGAHHFMIEGRICFRPLSCNGMINPFEWDASGEDAQLGCYLLVPLWSYISNGSNKTW
jgi:hypothetical protein